MEPNGRNLDTELQSRAQRVGKDAFAVSCRSETANAHNVSARERNALLKYAYHLLVGNLVVLISIQNDDERRRPISRAYMSTLTDRVSLLESMLKERGEDPPPVVYPPKTTRGSLNADGENSPTRPSMPRQHSTGHEPTIPEQISPASMNDDIVDTSHPDSNASVDGQRDRSEQEPSQGTPIDDKKEGILSRLLSTRGHLSFDQISGRLRYYGPTVNSHIYAELEVDDAKSSREMMEQTR